MLSCSRLGSCRKKLAGLRKLEWNPKRINFNRLAFYQYRPNFYFQRHSLNTNSNMLVRLYPMAYLVSCDWLLQNGISNFPQAHEPFDISRLGTLDCRLCGSAEIIELG